MSNRPLKIFFSGIGGSGVSALAGFMADRGHAVIGSDRSFDLNPGHPMRRLLLQKGITLVPQDGSGLDSSFDLAVFSTAVEPDRPEAVKARQLGIPVLTRPDYLARIVTEFRTVAVAGTSGKSTTSGLLSFLMRRLGREPNFIGGGRVKQFKADGNPGNAITGRSDILVIEACESDGTIVNYRPEHSILLNLDLDHYGIEKTAAMFEALGRNTAGLVIVNSDDEHLRRLAFRSAVGFSIDGPSRYQAKDVTYHPFHTAFTLNGVAMTLSLPGKYNLYNALSALALLAETGAQLDELAAALPEFSGIERRFDLHLNDGRRLVIDDYAHNPHKIASFMQAMAKVKERICYIFQPHGFAPTKMMRAEYIESFVRNLRAGDHLALLPIFYSGGTVSRDISSDDLAEGVRAGGRSVEVVSDRNELLARVGEHDAYAVLGARDETLADFAEALAARLESGAA